MFSHFRLRSEIPCIFRNVFDHFFNPNALSYLDGHFLGCNHHHGDYKKKSQKKKKEKKTYRHTHVLKIGCYFYVLKN